MSQLAQKYNAINLGQGFPDFDTYPELLERASYYLKAGKNQYCPMAGLPALRSTIARLYSRQYDVDIQEGEVTITAGATEALFCAIQAFVRPGNEVIIFEPAYDSYIPVIKQCGGVVVPVALEGPDFNIDWEEVKSHLSERTRLIMINSPHNPIGKVWQSKDLDALESLVEDRDINIISDEVYEHIVFDNHLHQSILSRPGLRQKSVAIYSFGKTFHATGWKIGYCIAPPLITEKIQNIHQWNVFSVNSFLQYALTDYLEGAFNPGSLGPFFQNKRDLFNNAIQDSELEYLPSQGTYFELLDYSSISNQDDVTFAEYLTREVGVAVIPISVFYSNPRPSKYVRICFAKNEDTLYKAAARLNTV